MEEKKYRLVSVTDKKGNQRDDIYNMIKLHHSLTGTLPNLQSVKVGQCLFFYYDDDSGLCMKTSTLTCIAESVGGSVCAATQNSIYTFEPLKKHITTEALRQFCIDNDYFTCGSNEQYKRLFELNNAQADTHELALVIWVCSNAAILEQIEEELDELLDQQELI